MHLRGPLGLSLYVGLGLVPTFLVEASSDVFCILSLDSSDLSDWNSYMSPTTSKNFSAFSSNSAPSWEREAVVV